MLIWVVVSGVSTGIDDAEYEVVGDEDEHAAEEIVEDEFAVEYEIAEDEDKVAAGDEHEIDEDEIDDCEGKLYNDGVVIDDRDDVAGGNGELFDEEETDDIIWISSSTTLEICFIDVSVLFRISSIFNWVLPMSCLLFI